MRNTNAIQAVVLAIFMALLSIAFAADKPATQADFNELQKQVNTIDKELAVLKETKAGLEKRQTEITGVRQFTPDFRLDSQSNQRLTADF